jgi:hypothetical protein
MLEATEELKATIAKAAPAKGKTAKKPPQTRR